MLERANKTLICSVAYLDIVGYSSRPVPEQMRLKQRLNDIIAASIKDIPLPDRVMLDTGDGAALCFLGDPEEALFAILACRDILREMEQVEPLNMMLRMGINLGPVKLIKDVNGQPNLIGDGVNTGERVMSFAEPGQIMVSRSYVDVVSRLSQEYGQLFQYHGLRTDKHVREHEVYEVCMSSASSPLLAQALHSRRSTESKRDAAIVGTEAAQADSAQDKRAAAAWRENPKLIYGALAALVVVVLAGSLYFGSPHPTQPMTGTASGPESPAAADKQVAVSEPAKSGAENQAGAEKPKSADETAATASATAAYIAIAVSPWGEIYLDGRKKGVAPPLKKLQVVPGKHIIEIRNTDFPSYTETVEVKAQDTVKVKHRFQ
ncbi:MAG: adenylate/guanylate cyclase domain-containing protein [Gammaproteobacteria bacterium]|nr:adenylate/guanylate cyclase domain-containing protein [Gammaproteobacteria bacterium]